MAEGETEERQTWLSAEVGQGGAWGYGTNATKQVGFEAENKLLIGLIKAAQTHNNQSLLELIHLHKSLCT